MNLHASAASCTLAMANLSTSNVKPSWAVTFMRGMMIMQAFLMSELELEQQLPSLLH